MTKLQELIQVVGQSNLARELGVSVGAVWHWKQGTQYPNVKLWPALRKRYGLKPKDIRPDLFS